MFMRRPNANKSADDQVKEKNTNVMIGATMAGVAAVASAQLLRDQEIRARAKQLAVEAAAMVKNRNLY